MEDHLSRRQILGIAAAVASGLVTTQLVNAQSGKNKSMERSTPELAKPLTSEAEALYLKAVQDVKIAATERLKSKLPDISEPCFTYKVSARRGDKK